MKLSESGKNFSVIAAAAIFSVAMIICTIILAGAAGNFTRSKNTITVTGAAKKAIRSDLIVWSGNFSAQSPQLSEAYAQLSRDAGKVKAYLQNKGISDSELVLSSINTVPVYRMGLNGIQTNVIEGYMLTQSVEINSSQVDKITELSRTSTELINEGVQFQSQPPQYFYTKLNDLKVDMLAEASKDAQKRAEQLAENSGGKIGALKSAKMGVFQITRLNSTEVSDWGINDTSSPDKEITAVVNVEFYVK
ncbi:MAG: SIMPL domain-containing protein [Bacillota bacterium]